MSSLAQPLLESASWRWLALTAFKNFRGGS